MNPKFNMFNLTQKERRDLVKDIRKITEVDAVTRVKICKLHADAVIPTYATDGAAGFDLHAVEDVIIEPGETVVIATGLAFEIPEGYEMQIRPRSGITKRTKLRIPNSPATIDSDFRSEVGVLMSNTAYPMLYTDDSVKRIDGTKERVPFEFCPIGTYAIRKGERIAQGIVCPVTRVEFVEKEILSSTEREGGFGSTGFN